MDSTVIINIDKYRVLASEPTRKEVVLDTSSRKDIETKQFDAYKTDQHCYIVDISNKNIYECGLGVYKYIKNEADIQTMVDGHVLTKDLYKGQPVKILRYGKIDAYAEHKGHICIASVLYNKYKLLRN